MRKTASLILVISTFYFYSCKKGTGDITLGIDVQSSFNNNNAKILVDGQQMIDQPLQTNYALGVCPVDGQLVLIKNQGSHELEVIVDNSISKTETFSLNKPLYIGVNYNNQTQAISFVYSNIRFIYD